MRGAIDVVLSRPRDGVEYCQALISVGEDVDRLRSIAEGLLMLARADAGAIAVEKGAVRLDVLSSEVLDSFRSAAAERGVVLLAQSAPDVVVYGDERWLRQLVYNLVDNAIKFSGSTRPGDNSPTIALEVLEQDGCGVLRIADSGPGIPEKVLPHVFERFFRADDARTYQLRDGFGLGLSIAAWIVEVHQGTISVANQAKGSGAVFCVTLPLARR